ncbi:MarR family winged helix-turn-helix transcriptional regulator [Lactobacillus sp. ESL0677]|uniref:MarR family winged helix-turn-helix transcriptional regulator n=1 Tax=Lactobacillus sp. ESL0677 TaxID=2983208 RepID=UPI0023F8113C|nr:MarR family winged helix-turn-helix transcriptional regulator [Lactobacillus sp. ESL0677]WEV36900.1 MarR family winged helix-turn-helix transcriptional regulator [Lactobacillus sp. ESL0677]
MKYYYLSKFIAGIYRQSKNEFNQQLANLNLRATQSDLLLFIVEHPNLMQREIAQQMVIDPSLLAKDLQVLLHQKLITRNKDSADGRVKRITATTNGKSEVLKLKQVMETWWQNLFAQHQELNTTEFFKQLEMGYQAICFRDTNVSSVVNKHN